MTITLYVNIVTTRTSAPAIVGKLLEMVGQHGMTVHDPLHPDEERQDMRVITCARLCRQSDDPREGRESGIARFRPPLPTEEQFQAFLTRVRAMPGVITLDVADQSFQVSPFYTQEEE